MTEIPAYERDPYLTTLETEVLEADLERDRHFVVLADTVFYPEGGGQPADRGTIGGVGVLDVRKAGDAVRHYLAGAGPAGTARAVLDWPRRFDHMQQHTGQHLLTAVAQARFGWSTTAFHLGEQGADIEMDTPAIGADQIAELEEAVAAEIRAARPVIARRVTPEEYAALPVRTRGLPEGFSGDIRLVEIQGIDLNTCGGTHVRCTAEVEGLKLLGSEPMRGGTRLFYAAGGRMRRLLGDHQERSAQLRQLLGTADEELAAGVQARLEQLKEAQRTVKGLEEALAIEAGRGLAAGSERVAAGHWPERDLPFLQRLAREFARLAPNRVVLLTAGPEAQGAFVLCAGDAAAIDLPAAGRRVAETLGGRGGGSGRLFQGKAALGAREAALACVRTLLEQG
jgi:alanyl-tRNA synthetase